MRRNRVKVDYRRQMGLSCCGLIAALAGCSGTPADNRRVHQEYGGDVGAIVTVVKDVYRQAGGGRVVFLGGDGGAAEEWAFGEARSRLETELEARVEALSERAFDDPLTPVDAGTGEVGVSVILGRFSVDEEGRLHVKVSLGQPNRPYRSCVEYGLERAGQDWSIIETTAGCSPSGHVFESYDSAVDRVRRGECRGMWANVGTCGSWLYVGTGGYGGQTAYYDPETRALVAFKTHVDHGPVFDRFLFGSVSCETGRPEETVLCGIGVED